MWAPFSEIPLLPLSHPAKITLFLRTRLLGPTPPPLLFMIQVPVPFQINHPFLSKVLSQAVRAYFAS